MTSAASGLSINTATVKEQLDLRQVVEACVRLGIPAIAPWRDQIAATGLAEAARIVKGSGLQVTGVIRGGLFPAADKAAREAAIDDNRRAIDEAATLGADCLVLIAGGLPKGSRDIAAARGMVADGIAAVLPHARASGVPLALEPLHPMYAADRACVTTLAEALDICDLLAPGDGRALGVAIDTYHVWWDPALVESIARAGRGGRILAHHICDWLVPTRDMLLDRGMMGDGVIDFRGFRRMIEAAGFTGPQEVEIFSAHDWWKRPADEVLRTCIERHDKLCRA
jgi:sugar phosphate isomerase/epimerase